MEDESFFSGKMINEMKGNEMNTMIVANLYCLLLTLNVYAMVIEWIV